MANHVENLQTQLVRQHMPRLGVQQINRMHNCLRQAVVVMLQENNACAIFQIDWSFGSRAHTHTHNEVHQSPLLNLRNEYLEKYVFKTIVYRKQQLHKTRCHAIEHCLLLCQLRLALIHIPFEILR